MISRRRLLASFGAGAVLCPWLAEGQRVGKVYTVGILTSDPTLFLPTFREALRDYGYIEGRNLIVQARYDEGEAARLPAFAAELVKLGVDVIVAPSSTHVRAARQATRTIPIVFVAHNDPVGSGDVASLEHPGGNITGTAQLVTELVTKQLEFLGEGVLGVKDVALLWNPTTPSHREAAAQAESAARRLDFRLLMLQARNGADLDAAFGIAAAKRAGLVLLVASPMAVAERRRLGRLGAMHRIRTMYPFRLFVEAGGLLAYGPDLSALYRRAAGYVDRILQGAKPADLPVEQPTRFELVINLKTAKALGVTISQSLLLRADEVIQ